jgi:hypothetical protein
MFAEVFSFFLFLSLASLSRHTAKELGAEWAIPRRGSARTYTSTDHFALRSTFEVSSRPMLLMLGGESFVQVRLSMLSGLAPFATNSKKTPVIDTFFRNMSVWI